MPLCHEIQAGSLVAGTFEDVCIGAQYVTQNNHLGHMPGVVHHTQSGPARTDIGQS